MMKNLSRNLTGGFSLLIAAGILAALFFIELPAGNREVALVAFGMALGWAGAVVNFHFGSSEGSKAKTDLLAKQGEAE